MCPLCVTTIALMTTGGTTAGGLAALVVRRFAPGKRRSIRPKEADRKDEFSQATENDDEGETRGSRSFSKR
jgi:hypothetical protein